MSGLLDDMNGGKSILASRGKKTLIPLVAITALLGLLVWGAKEHPGECAKRKRDGPRSASGVTYAQRAAVTSTRPLRLVNPPH